MAEPLPSASTADDSQPLPTNAEDRKAAAALNALDSNTLDSSSDPSGGKTRSAIDHDALGKAMNRLDIAAPTDDEKTKAETTTTKKKKTWWQEKKEREDEDARRKKAVKVKAEDVAFLVDQLELSRAKATDLLKSFDADVARAVRAFVAPAPAATALVGGGGS